MEMKRLTCISNATETGSARQAKFQYLLNHFNSLCFHMFIKFSKMVKKLLQFTTFSIVFLTCMASHCVIKDYFQIAMFKERIFIFFFYITHLQAQGKVCANSDLLGFRDHWFSTESYRGEKYFPWTFTSGRKRQGNVYYTTWVY